MNFFKSSFFSDFKLPEVFVGPQDPDADGSDYGDAKANTNADSDAYLPNNPQVPHDDATADPLSSSAMAHDATQARVWGLGGLMKSLTLKSEEMLQAYRKDLEDFGTGLKEESKVIAAVATQAVKVLPSSLETGATVAQESLESVGQVIEDFGSSVWRGTAEIIAQGKDAMLKVDEDHDASTSSTSVSRYDDGPLFRGKYSRFEAQVRAMQHDSTTYCDEPEEQEDYMAWKSVFDLTNQGPDIQSLLNGNTFMQELFARFVPEVVTEEDFWTRYFYRLHKIRQTEDARADLVKRAAAFEEEDLTWDTEEEADEEEHDGNSNEKRVVDISEGAALQSPSGAKKLESSMLATTSMQENTGEKSTDGDDTTCKGIAGGRDNEQVSAEEEDDLGWEVAEDIEESSSNDGRRSASSEASWVVPAVPGKDIRQKVAAQEDEEELSWDVDDVVDAKS